jgi:type III pantothenate kinase
LSNSKSLLLDIGNTRTKWALVELSQGLQEIDFTRQPSGATVNQYDLIIQECSQLLKALANANNTINQILICSVNQTQWIQVWTDYFQELFPTIHMIQLHGDTCIPNLHNAYDEPASLGADRWAAIIAASQLAPLQNCLIINSGTATTIDFLEHGNVFVGGSILPGVSLSLEALQSQTARLESNITSKNFNFFEPSSTLQFSKNTKSAIFNGVMQGQIGAIKQALELAPQTSTMIFSGGNGPLILKHLYLQIPPTIQIIEDPYLVLRGLFFWQQFVQDH